MGITSVCDATPDLDDAAVRALAAGRNGGALPQRLELWVPRSGADLRAGLRAGPYKIVIADSALPALDELVERVRRAHDAGRAVAFHCVTREALVLLLAALETTGGLPGDRVEHAALVPAELIPELARHGLRVVTQPGFLAHRGDDYLRDVPIVEHGDLYRCRSLVEAASAWRCPVTPRTARWTPGRSSPRPRNGARPRAPSPGRGAPAAGPRLGRLPVGSWGSWRAAAAGAPRRPRRPRAPGPAMAAQLAAPTADAVRTVLVGGRPVA